MRPFEGLRLKVLTTPCLLLAGLVVGLFLAFPETALKERVEHELSRLPVEVRIGRLDLRPPLGVQAEEVRLRPHGDFPELTFDRAAARPLWLSLLGGNPGVALRAERAAGSLNGTFRLDGSVTARAVDLGLSIPMGDLAGLRLDGVLREGELSGTFPPPPGATVSLELRLENAALSGLAALGVPIDALPLGTVTLHGTGEGRAFKLDRLAADGGDFRLDGSGTIMLGKTAASSRVDLDLTLVPGPGFPAELVELVELVARSGRAGGYRLHVTGPLVAPQIR